MELSPSGLALLGLAFASGALHVFIPDHWLPASVVAWQRGWSLPRTALFGAALLVPHVLLGAAIYFAFGHYLGSIEPSRILVFAMVLVCAVIAVRLMRLGRLKEVLRAGPKSRWGIFAVISLLGPCESLIPILIKAGQLGMGSFTPVLAFLAGSLIAGPALIVAGRILWDRPAWLAWSISWVMRRPRAIPVATSLALIVSLGWALK